MIEDKTMHKESILVFADKIYHRLYQAISPDGEMVEVYSCSEAFELIKDCQANIVLIDFGFEINKGLKLLKEIKTLHPSVPIILLTDTSSEEAAIKAFRAGAREYLRKPVNIFELQGMIKSLLEIKRTSNERRLPFVPSRSGSFGELSTIPTTDKPTNLLLAIRYIEENLTDKICLTNCAKEANLSKYHFCRNFKKYMGMSPMKFVMAMRISRAKELLQRDNLNIIEIALEVGFNDYSCFIRGFKKFTGLTPKKYRDSLKMKNRLSLKSAPYTSSSNI